MYSKTGLLGACWLMAYLVETVVISAAITMLPEKKKKTMLCSTMERWLAPSPHSGFEPGWLAGWPAGDFLCGVCTSTKTCSLIGRSKLPVGMNVNVSALWWTGNLSSVYPVSQPVLAGISSRTLQPSKGWAVIDNGWLDNNAKSGDYTDGSEDNVVMTVKQSSYFAKQINSAVFLLTRPSHV